MDIVTQTRITNLCKSISSDKDIHNYFAKQLKIKIPVEEIAKLRKVANG